MEKRIWISRGIISVMTLIGTLLFCINEDPQTAIIAAVVFMVVAFLASLIATPICSKIIDLGDRISTKVWKICFYGVLFPTSIAILAVLWSILYALFDRMETPNEMSAVLGQAAIGILLLAIVAFVVLVPYFQTLLLLLLRKLLPEKNKNDV